MNGDDNNLVQYGKKVENDTRVKTLDNRYCRPALYLRRAFLHQMLRVVPFVEGSSVTSLVVLIVSREEKVDLPSSHLTSTESGTGGSFDQSE